jgi:hypothetical protein
MANDANIRNLVVQVLFDDFGGSIAIEKEHIYRVFGKYGTIAHLQQLGRAKYLVLFTNPASM